ncbi:hypothetical protein [Fangia hongkongensis]|uniref:hypothetical protein n=1 Tax=Fangia hongkongensis TaxID=270495 RepID=UPI000375F2FA|nr:hypothetical protein [Fangia hongkongensis]MBK2124225.1 hypothetical protein [Fangia hongkongensis]
MGKLLYIPRYNEVTNRNLQMLADFCFDNNLLFEINILTGEDPHGNQTEPDELIPPINWACKLGAKHMAKAQFISFPNLPVAVLHMLDDSANAKVVVGEADYQKLIYMIDEHAQYKKLLSTRLIDEISHISKGASM